jgi:hypothetical protein
MSEQIENVKREIAQLTEVVRSAGADRAVLDYDKLAEAIAKASAQVKANEPVRRGEEIASPVAEAGDKNAEIKGGKYDGMKANDVLFAEYTGLSIQRSTNGGITFSFATTGISDNGFQFIAPFAMNTANRQQLWTGGWYIWRTTDQANSWVRASATNPSQSTPAVFKVWRADRAVAPVVQTSSTRITPFGTDAPGRRRKAPAARRFRLSLSRPCEGGAARSRSSSIGAYGARSLRARCQASGATWSWPRSRRRERCKGMGATTVPAGIGSEWTCSARRAPSTWPTSRAPSNFRARMARRSTPR